MFILQSFDLFLLHVHKNLELLILKSKHTDTENHIPSTWKHCKAFPEMHWCTWSCCSSAALASHCSCTAFSWLSWLSWRLCLSSFWLASSSDKNWEGKPVLLCIGLIYYMLFCFFWIQTCVRRCRCSGPFRPSFLSSVLNWFKWDFASAFWAFWKDTLSWACNDFCPSIWACWNREALSLSYRMREQNHRRLSG